MIVRSATVADIDEILELNRQIGQYHYDNAPDVFVSPSAEEKEFLLQAVLDEKRLFSVAVDEKHVVGFISAKIDINESIPFLSKQPICRIGTIVVDENCRSKGIGKHLMDHCYSWAQENKAYQVRLEVMSFNSRAMSFYQSLGFQPQSEIWVK
ncbi:GNAT family N-acetyltransferase [Vibrio sp. S4M6]|uniref:GNAT family N-acetyltransferase n=1 Tax=Vibrio sinus TaxID=2946865 RepID=UPI00202A904C|nr:GNAT family N-acetyltransferase [Vibrio sinus]